MFRHAFAAATVLASLVLATAPAHAASDQQVLKRIEQLHGHSDGFEDPFFTLRDAMQRGDARDIADLGEYPLTVNANGETYEIQSADDFVENFQTLVTPQTRRAVAREKLGNVLVNSDGVGLANGAVWLSAICQDNACNNTYWAIISINN
jgi:hypothetical protein